ncbi:camphor resistance [Legionella beliardensis]|uniref:Fluoride-specific ion channel FluC n=1 Tax=Legionella beliardensis TaxID=91822 RepID=A0A378I6H7_9GAMM|nr:fluoride efflux transporter CrcB [Legionella beliardensis]STX28064.1 camphor resistance [Legionella beliardensis]
MFSILSVAVGGALGAMARFGTVTLVQELFGLRFPFGTLVVNTIGSFLAGFIMIILLERFAVGDAWRLFLVVGFLGAYTTFSSFAWETWALIESGKVLFFWLNILLNNVFSLSFAFLGIHLARWLGGNL